MAYEYFFADLGRRFWLGMDLDSASHCLSFIVPTPMSDYEEIYMISAAQFSAFLSDSAAALRFVAVCNRGGHEDLLVVSRRAA